MKKLLTITFCFLAFASAHAGGNKKTGASKEEMNLNIRIDKKGELHINGKNIDDKAIEDWLTRNLKNISIEINDEGKESKKIEVSLKIKEK